MRTFFDYAVDCYNNPGCIDEKEFKEDFDRFTRLKRSFSVYEKTGRIDVRWVLNQIIIILNVFPPPPGLKMLNMKFSDKMSILKPFLQFMNHWSDDELNVSSDSVIVRMLTDLDTEARGAA